MARIRTIKPEMFQDEKLAPLPVVVRFVFIGLISMADDAGRLVDNVKLIDGFLFPETDDSSADALDILARIERILRYRSESNQKLIQIVNWHAHQRVDNPSKYTLPPPPAQVVQPLGVTEVTRHSREGVAQSSRSDQRPTISDPDHDPRSTTTTGADAADVGEFCCALVVALNQGMYDNPRIGEQFNRIPATHGKSFTAAETIAHANVPIEFAKSIVYEMATSFTPESRSRQIKSLGYCTDHVIRRWEEHCAAQDSNAIPRPDAAPPASKARARAASNPGAQSYANAIAALEDL